MRNLALFLCQTMVFVLMVICGLIAAGVSFGHFVFHSWPEWDGWLVIILSSLATFGLWELHRLRLHRFFIVQRVAIPLSRPRQRRPGKRAQDMQFDDVQWKHPIPEPDLFAEAQRINCPVWHGMNEFELKESIDEERERLEAEQPASEKALRQFAKRHIELPRRVSRREADEIAEYLIGLMMPCPQCGEIAAFNGGLCVFCGCPISGINLDVQLVTAR